VFSVAKMLLHRPVLVLLALVVLATVAAHSGNPWLGMWDGPL
jgi:hypothetical protein